MAEEKKKEPVDEVAVPGKEVEHDRLEDSLVTTPKGFKPAPLSSKEVDPESQRRDHTSLLATDTVRVTEDNELEIIPA